MKEKAGFVSHVNAGYFWGGEHSPSASRSICDLHAIRGLLAILAALALALASGTTHLAWADEAFLSAAESSAFGAQAEKEVTLADGVASVLNQSLASGDSLVANFTVTSNTFGFFELNVASNFSATVKLKQAGKVVDEWEPYSTQGSHVHGPVPLRKGSYVLTITSDSSATQVNQLKYRTTAPTWLDMTTLEDETANNTLPGELITLGKPVSASLCHKYSEQLCSDSDRYTFTLPAEKHVVIDFKAPDSTGTSLKASLCSTDGKVLSSSIDGKTLNWSNNSALSGTYRIVDFAEAALDCGNIPAGTYTLYANGESSSFEGGSNYRDKMYYQTTVNAYKPLPVVDPTCAVLTADGSISKCTSTGEPIDEAWAYPEYRKVTTLYIAANATSIPEKWSVETEDGAESWSFSKLEDNVESIVFLLDASGRNSVASFTDSQFGRATTYGGMNSTLAEIKNLEKTRITSIGSYAFSYLTNLKSVSLPPTLKTIGPGAFSECWDLESVSLPPSLTEIGAYAFNGCTSLKSVNGLQETGVTTLESHLFDHCFELESINLPKKLTTINSGCFELCDNLSSVTSVSPYVKSVYSDAFTGTLLDDDESNGSSLLVHRASYPTFYWLDVCPSHLGIIENTKGTLSEAEFSSVQNGKFNFGAHTPKPEVTYADLSLKEGTDYTLSYKDNVNAGTGKIIITGIGNYEGNKTIAFGIDAANMSDVSISCPATVTYTGKPATPKATLKLGKHALKQGVDYTVSYQYNDTTGLAFANYKGMGNFVGTGYKSFKIAKAKAKKFTVKKVKKQKLKKAGKAVKPKVTVKFAGKKLKAGRDYKVTYKNNKKRGTAKIVIKGAGNFSGKKVVKFKIV